MKFSENNCIRRVQRIAEYQFGRGIGTQLITENCTIIHSRSGDVRQVLLDGKHLATLRAHDGRLTLGLKGAILLHSILPVPLYRVTIEEAFKDFIIKGKNVFAKHVISADKEISPYDEVLVVLPDDSFLATGSAVLSGDEMLSFKYGVAVKVRKGRED